MVTRIINKRPRRSNYRQYRGVCFRISFRDIGHQRLLTKAGTATRGSMKASTGRKLWWLKGEVAKAISSLRIS